jgi:hypothetical protein
MVIGDPSFEFNKPIAPHCMPVVNERYFVLHLSPLNFVLRSLSHEGRAREPTNLSGIINGLNNAFIQAQVYTNGAMFCRH